MRSISISWQTLCVVARLKPALSPIIAKQRSALRVRVREKKIHEFAITIPVVLPDKDYPLATRKDSRLENCPDRLLCKCSDILSSLLLTGKSLLNVSILNPKTMICKMQMAYDKHDIDNLSSN